MFRMSNILKGYNSLIRISSRTGMRGKKMTHTYRAWIMKREGRLADKDPPRALAKVDERKYAENYEYTTWDPTSTRTSRPAFGSDGKMDSLHFMSQARVRNWRLFGQFYFNS